MKRSRWDVAIIGAGKVGSVLGRILADRGGRVVAVISRSRSSARKCARFVGCKLYSTSLDDLPPETSLILITTPHGAVEEVGLALSRLEQLRFKRLNVCHASGMLTAEALAPLAARGATVFSFHPLQTFPRDFEPRDIVDSIVGIYYGVDGTRKGLATARRLATLLRGHTIEVPPEMRVFYHAACVVASNHLTGLLAVLESMYAKLGNSQKKFFPVFMPIIMATLRNVNATSPVQALSGPVARGGTETVARHFDAVRTYAPELIRYFSSLTDETITLAARKGSLSPERVEEMRQLVQSLLQPTSTSGENR
jgi:predicted short-subunit dehydrogenase-like oxidoreductase (DUF2520 family)